MEMTMVRGGESMTATVIGKVLIPEKHLADGETVGENPYKLDVGKKPKWIDLTIRGEKQVPPGAPCTWLRKPASTEASSGGAVFA